MSMSRKKKWLIFAVGAIAVLFLIVPFVLGLSLHGSVQGELEKALGVPVKLGGLSVSLLFPGASLSGLEIGAPSPLAGNQPLAKIPSLTAKVSFGTVLGGAPHLRFLRMEGAQIHLGADGQGRAVLKDFLAGLPKSEAPSAFSLGHLRILNAKVFLHLPKTILDPKGAGEVKPVEIVLGSMTLDDLFLPAPGAPSLNEGISVARLDSLQLRSHGSEGLPSSGEVRSPSPPIEEGVGIARMTAQFQVPGVTDRPLRIREFLLMGVQVKNRLVAFPDTLSRIRLALNLCLALPPSDPQSPARPLSNGSLFLERLESKNGVVEVEGRDARGALAWWRLDGLQLDFQRLALGPGVQNPGDPGLMKIEANSNSTQGKGSFKMAWENVTGAWPQLTFDNKIFVHGMALTPFSKLVEEAVGVGFESGAVAFNMEGRTEAGGLNWEGSATLSEDTKFSGKGLTSAMAGMVVGTPIKPITVRGTLQDPKVGAPSAAKFIEIVFSKTFLGPMGIEGLPGLPIKDLSIPKALPIPKAQEVIKKVPGLGGFLGGKEKK